MNAANQGEAVGTPTSDSPDAQNDGRTTRIGADWRIRWWHRFGRADLVAVIAAVFGVLNSGNALIHGDYAGLGWLCLVPVGVVLFAASGIERADSPTHGRTLFDRVAVFGRQLDSRLPDTRSEHSTRRTKPVE